MSRICAGTVILLLLLGACSIFSFWMPRVHLDISRQLEQSAQQARQENWQQAGDLADRAASSWKKARVLTEIAADHEPIDEIDALFAELEVYAARREITEFAATAAHLSRLTAALGKNHGFSLRNLL